MWICGYYLSGRRSAQGWCNNRVWDGATHGGAGKVNISLTRTPQETGVAVFYGACFDLDEDVGAITVVVSRAEHDPLDVKGPGTEFSVAQN